jgi:RNA polymerase sigma-70 factor (ECF subfamily)
MKNRFSQNQGVTTLDDSFGTIYTDYYDKILAFVQKKVYCKNDAEDVTSLVFIKAFQKLYTYECRGNGIGAWLFRIAINETNQYFRSKKQSRFNIDLIASEDLFEELEKEELEDKLALALSRLSDYNLRLIQYRFFEKMSFAEIGEKLNITENNAKVKCHRSVLKLKVVFSDL